jgi:hypothetical protein
VAEALRHFDGERIAQIASVVMPNHVHAVFVLNAAWPLERIILSWKWFTARGINPLIGRKAIFGSVTILIGWFVMRGTLQTASVTSGVIPPKRVFTQANSCCTRASLRRVLNKSGALERRRSLITAITLPIP